MVIKPRSYRWAGYVVRIRRCEKHTKCLSESLEEIYDLGYLGIGGRIILK
jgi:hypothetical protein